MALKYEPTITLGNILAALTMLGGATAAWTSMSREVERTQGQIAVVHESTVRQDLEMRDLRSDTKQAINELRSDIKELSQKIGMALANQAASAPRR